MNYLLHRVKEARGFIAKRAFDNAYFLALSTYGMVAELNGRILLPGMMVLDIQAEMVRGSDHRE